MIRGCDYPPAAQHDANGLPHPLLMGLLTLPMRQPARHLMAEFIKAHNKPEVCVEITAQSGRGD